MSNTPEGYLVGGDRPDGRGSGTWWRATWDARAMTAVAHAAPGPADPDTVSRTPDDPDLQLARDPRAGAGRLMVLAGTGLVTASVLVGASLTACPAISTAALWAGGRTVVWLTAVLLLSAGLGAALRSVIGASTAAAVLVILAPQLAAFLGDAARWLPGQAAQIWLAADTSRADVASAGLIILAWTAAAQIAGIVRLVRADG
mgnify:CR=1 FL=1